MRTFCNLPVAGGVAGGAGGTGRHGTIHINTIYIYMKNFVYIYIYVCMYIVHICICILHMPIIRGLYIARKLTAYLPKSEARSMSSK